MVAIFAYDRIQSLLDGTDRSNGLILERRSEMGVNILGFANGLLLLVPEMPDRKRPDGGDRYSSPRAGSR